MHTFLLCSGVRGQSQSLDLLRRLVDSRRPDGILFAGGILPAGRAYEPKGTPWGMTREDSLFVERFFRAFGELGVFSAIVPGDSDTPLDDFLRLGMNAEIEFPTLHVVHATMFTRDGLAVIGLGGPVAEGSACELDCCSRTLAQYLLRTLPAAKQPHKVLLLGQSGAGASDATKVNVLPRELIDSLHPGLCVIGGGDASHVWRVAHTIVVHPGSLVDGRLAWFDWRRSPEQRVELLNVGDSVRATARS